jgi:hypothetical protein
VLVWYDPEDPQDILVYGREGRFIDRAFLAAGLIFVSSARALPTPRPSADRTGTRCQRPEPGIPAPRDAHADRAQDQHGDGSDLDHKHNRDADHVAGIELHQTSSAESAGASAFRPGRKHAWRAFHGFTVIAGIL